MEVLVLMAEAAVLKWWI